LAQGKIVVIRDVQVMIYRDLAELYGVKKAEDKRGRHTKHFPYAFEVL
jgi:hypothetical protein